MLNKKLKQSFNRTQWRETEQCHIMTDDSPSRDTFNTSRFPTISDYDDLEQNTDGHITLETNLNVKCINFITSLQKKPPEVFCNKRCCKKYRCNTKVVVRNSQESTKVPSLEVDFAAFSCAIRNSWEKPCISHVVKYTIRWKSDGRKVSIRQGKNGCQFLRLSQADGFRWIFPCYGKLMGKPI